MLVDLGALDAAEVEHLAARDHGSGQGQRLGAGHATNADSHQPGRHLVVGDVAAQVTRQEEFDLLGRVLSTVAFAADDVERNHCRQSFHIADPHGLRGNAVSL